MRTSAACKMYIALLSSFYIAGCNMRLRRYLRCEIVLEAIDICGRLSVEQRLVKCLANVRQTRLSWNLSMRQATCSVKFRIAN